MSNNVPWIYNLRGCPQYGQILRSLITDDRNSFTGVEVAVVKSGKEMHYLMILIVKEQINYKKEI